MLVFIRLGQPRYFILWNFEPPAGELHGGIFSAFLFPVDLPLWYNYARSGSTAGAIFF